MNDHATTQVRAVAAREAEQLQGWLSANKSAGDASLQAHLAYAAAQIEQFHKDPKKLDLTAPAEPSGRTAYRRWRGFCRAPKLV